MEFLSQHIKETIDRVDGFVTGTVVVEEEKVTLLQSDNTEITLDDSYSIISIHALIKSATCNCLFTIIWKSFQSTHS